MSLARKPGAARTSLGSDFAKVWTASAVSNIGDGVTMIAGPLLVAQLTGDPGLVAGAAFVHQLPWLLLALVSGAYVDRLDRRRLVIVVNLGRSAALAAVATDSVTIPLVYAVFFLLGTGETLVDTAYAAIVPRLVPDAHLERANARLMATFVVGNQLAAKPLGAYLFVAGAAVPFGFDAMTFLVAAALLAAERWRLEGARSGFGSGRHECRIRETEAARSRSRYPAPRAHRRHRFDSYGPPDEVLRPVRGVAAH